jgi:CRP-like cAMP-binding protein
LAYLVAELRQRLGAMGMVVNEQFEFPITQVKLADALGVSVVHVNRILQSFRTQGILDVRRQIVTLGDFEKIVQLGGFDNLENYISLE